MCSLFTLTHDDYIRIDGTSLFYEAAHDFCRNIFVTIFFRRKYIFLGRKIENRGFTENFWYIRSFRGQIALEQALKSRQIQKPRKSY